MKPRIINKDIGDPRTIGKIPGERCLLLTMGQSSWCSLHTTFQFFGYGEVLRSLEMQASTQAFRYHSCLHVYSWQIAQNTL